MSLSEHERLRDCRSLAPVRRRDELLQFRKPFWHYRSPDNTQWSCMTSGIVVSTLQMSFIIIAPTSSV
jgi:hypothetical protein